MVNAGNTPELLIRKIAHTQNRRAIEHAPTIAVPMNHKPTVTAKTGDTGKTDTVHAHHDAGPTQLFNQIMAASHLVEFASDIERIHHLLACSLRMPIDDAHHRRGTIRERTMRTVALQFV